MSTNTTRHRTGSFNGTVVFGLAMGVIMFGVAAWAGQPVLGLAFLAIMTVYSAVLWRGDGNDVVQILRGEPADERYQAMSQRSIVFATNVLAFVTVAMFVYEIATDGNPGPYSLMGFVFAVSMVSSLIWQRFRS